MNYLPGDFVRYVGHKFFQDLNAKTGVVVGFIENQKNVFVVDFGDDTYILRESSLVKSYSKPVVEHKSRKSMLSEED
jgi:NAD kinase